MFVGVLCCISRIQQGPSLKTLTAVQAQCGALQLDDRSNYTVLPPRIWGLIPRLAARLSVERTNAIFTQEAGRGFTLSVELLEVESTGYKGEPGNFISRSAVLSRLHIPWHMPPGEMMS